MSVIIILPDDITSASEIVAIRCWMGWESSLSDQATEYPVENHEAAADAVIQGPQAISLSCVFDAAEVADGILDKLKALRGRLLNIDGPDGFVFSCVLLSMAHSVTSDKYAVRAVELRFRTIGVGTPEILQREARPATGKALAPPKNKGQTAPAEETDRSTLQKLVDGAGRLMEALGGAG